MPMFRKALLATVVVLVALTFVPSQLAAEEREAPAGVRVSASMLDWFSAAWSDLTSWFAGAVVPPTPTDPSPTTDGSCTIDPDGRCREGQQP
jgi:hypothetical protein